MDIKLQGRMNATVRTVVWGTLPVGTLIGGFLASEIGIANSIFVGGFIAGLAFLWIITGPVFRMKEHPKSLIVSEDAGDSTTVTKAPKDTWCGARLRRNLSSPYKRKCA